MAKILKSGTYKGVNYEVNQEISDELVTNDLIKAGFVQGVLKEEVQEKPKKRKSKKKDEKENAENILLTDASSDVNVSVEEVEDKLDEEKPLKTKWFSKK